MAGRVPFRFSKHTFIIAVAWRQHDSGVEYLFPAANAYMDKLCHYAKGEFSDRDALALALRFIQETFAIRPAARPQFIRRNTQLPAVIVAFQLSEQEISRLSAPVWVKAGSVRDGTELFLRSAATRLPRRL